MRTVNQLVTAGFTVRPAADAIDCTELVSDRPFWHFNPRFMDDGVDASFSRARAVLSALVPATLGPDGHRLLVAGKFAGDDEFPMEVIDQDRKSIIHEAFTRHQEYANLAERALDDLNDALNIGEPYLI